MKESDVILCGHGSGFPRTIKADVYNGQRYSQKVTKNGKTWRKGLVAVMRPKRLTDDLRKAYHDKYSTILGRNYYSQTKRKYCYTKYSDGKYYSDCSSSQCLTLAAIGLDMPDFNTVGIFESDRFEKVLVHVENGHILDPEVLRVGDLLLYAGADPDRVLHIGHVEGVYEIASGPVGGESVEKYQKFLNENYAQLLKSYAGGLLSVDGEYGEKTRAASVTIWKYMANKYYGANLDPANHNFYESSKAVADDILNAEVTKHPTFGYILNGILSGRGFGDVYGGTFTAKTRGALLAFQKAKLLPQTGRLSGDVWLKLFN